MFIKPNMQKIKQVIASLDWGYRNAGIILVGFIDYDNIIYIVHEVYMTNQTMEWWLDTAKEIKAFFAVEEFVCDPAEPAFIDQFNQAGLSASRANNDVHMGIQAVKKRLKVRDDGKPSLFVMRGCRDAQDHSLKEAGKPTCLQEEFGGYVWANKQTREEPVKANDHALDALRYLVAYVDTGNAQVTYGTIKDVFDF